jgi:hypothetical protein
MEPRLIRLAALADFTDADDSGGQDASAWAERNRELDTILDDGPDDGLRQMVLAHMANVDGPARLSVR